MRLALVAAALAASTAAGAREPPGLHEALAQLAVKGKFSGAVVVQGADGVRFARGYGLADPFAGRRFTPDTPVDSASLAKPVTAATVLVLAREGRIDLDAPVQTYLSEYPQAETTVRHLLAHSAGLTDEAVGSIVGKTNAQLLAEFRKPDVRPLFAPGTGFSYCNFCYSTLALLIERVTGVHYLTAVRGRAALPSSVTLRPARLVDWPGRAIGYRRANGTVERADSYENELFYGTANFSISAKQLAAWGSQWWRPTLAPILSAATTPAAIAGKPSGLTWGNWYCAPGGLRCHYLGHHEGFHHMLYWDRKRQLAIAMVSNNSLAPELQQRLQRTIVAAAEGRRQAIRTELAAPLPNRDVHPGAYRLRSGERLVVNADGSTVSVIRSGLAYRAYRIGEGIRYLPGLDTYIAGRSDGGLHWLSLYEDGVALADPD
jgi:CubicO group peptidase (beta-lactamase class C family)